MVKVKICGITNVRDARAAIEAGASFLGLNFYPGSARYITPEAAKRIVKRLPKGVDIVGVFVNEQPANVLKVAREVGLSRVQLHGEESPEDVAALRRKLPVIKAVRVQPKFSSAQLGRFDRANAFLLDGFDKRARGGTGKTFDWKLAQRAGKNHRMFLAGGLNSGNVAEAIRVARPYAVDICSGVESSSPRKKDAAKIAALMAAVRGVTRSRKRSKRK
ncbi:MAG: phosphoribosylanthranilate isomerase [Candidatus Acidiferrales bacterium]